MSSPREAHRSGLDCLEAVTSLLQRVRNAHPVDGVYEAAEIHFWWSIPRRTDAFEQLVWLDEDGRAEAVVFVVDFGDGSSLVFDEPTLVVVTMPGAPTDWVAHVIDRGLAHVAERGISAVEVEVDQTDHVTRDALVGRGFERKGDAVVVSWLESDKRPPVSPLGDGYRLLSRADTAKRPHHLADERRPDIDDRLRQTSLYRPDLDLAVFTDDGDLAGYGVCWFDPATSTGVVEPMRTHDEHQRRGLARHILTSGIDRLAAAGARRISIGYEPDNPASGHLYRSVGFVPHQRTDLYGGPTASA